MGRDLDRISRGLGAKIPVVVAEGNKRPEAPMQAAKLASECGIVLRQHVPVLSHWKLYKNKTNKHHVDNYMSKVAGKFAMDITNKGVKEALTDLLRSGLRQMRRQLKKDYFDGVPANQVRTTSPLGSTTDEQWKSLVDLWSSPKHKVWICMQLVNVFFRNLSQVSRHSIDAPNFSIILHEAISTINART